MKYIFLTTFFMIELFMFIDGLYREDTSAIFMILYMTDIYALMFTALYCIITYAEKKEDEEIGEELKEIEKIKSPENSSL